MLGIISFGKTVIFSAVQGRDFLRLLRRLKWGSVLFLMILLSGCATYKFQKGPAPYDKGYVVSRDNYTIVEYTVGENNTVPEDLALAKERFSRRRRIIEDFYKKMGSIENRFKMGFADYPVMMFKLVTGVFRLPFIGVSDYRYDHDPKYKERILKIEEQKDALEFARVAKLKDKMANYVKSDLAKEQFTPGVAVLKEAAAAPERTAVFPQPLGIEKSNVVESHSEPASAIAPDMAEEPKPQLKVASQDVPATKPRSRVPDSGLITAVVNARPVKGFSPLRVQFSAKGSFSPHARIVSYSWDFGDGDVSTKASPVNTYYSASFEPRHFTATLTVQDNLGNTSTQSIIIEVLNK